MAYSIQDAAIWLVKVPLAANSRKGELGTQAHKAQSMTEADANMDDRPIIDNYDVSSPDLYIYLC